MPTNTSAVWSLDKAVAAAIENDTELALILTEYAGKPGIFSAKAPRDAGYPRIVVGDTNESSHRVFGRAGNDVATMLHIWSNLMGRQQVLEIYQHLVRLLYGTYLTLDGHSVYRSVIRLVTVLPDPVEPVMHGVAEHSAWVAAGT